MKYEEALKRWGATKIGTDDWENVLVRFDFSEGFACCGGTDPDCYCSFAESPSFDIAVTYGRKHWSQDLQYGMTEFLQELFEISA